MIRGLSALQAAATHQHTAKAKTAAAPPSRDIQPRPGMDTLHVSPGGKQLAASDGDVMTANRRADFGTVRTFGKGGAQLAAHGARAAAVVRTTDGETVRAGKASATVKITPPGAEGGAGITVTREVSMVATTSAEGVKTYKALQSVSIEKPTPGPIRPVEQQSMLDRMRSSMFSAEGDDGFDASLDLNSDGQINFGDLSVLAAKQEASQNTAALVAAGPQDSLTIMPVVTQPVVDQAEVPREDPLEAVRAAFFTSSGEEGFNAHADINGDGRVDFADLAELS